MKTPVAIVGAGPYGLAAAAHLRARGVEPLVLGRVMGAWEQMPARMLLRSFRESTSIGDPERRFTLAAFERDRGRPVAAPVSVREFVEYGRWFHGRVAPETDERLVRMLGPAERGFRLLLQDGTEVTAGAVVVAAGIEPFVHVPSELAAVNHGLVSHSSSHSDFAALAGRRVLVVGGGQSALEWGVLAHEAGAEVEIVTRARPRFLRGERVHDRAGALRALLYPSWGVGPPGLNWLMGRPEAYRRLPAAAARRLAYRAIRPAGAAWLRPRLAPLTLTAGRTVREARDLGDEVGLSLDDGSERRADHLIAATGYRIDVARYPFLAPELVERIERRDGFPRLTRAYESTVPGLHFVGAPAAATMGPGMRFVSHSGMAAAAVARRLARVR